MAAAMAAMLAAALMYAPSITQLGALRKRDVVVGKPALWRMLR